MNRIAKITRTERSLAVIYDETGKPIANLYVHAYPSEGADHDVLLREIVAKHGNYTPESTVLFVGQALSAVRAALSAREGGGK